MLRKSKFYSLMQVSEIATKHFLGLVAGPSALWTIWRDMTLRALCACFAVLGWTQSPAQFGNG